MCSVYNPVWEVWELKVNRKEKKAISFLTLSFCPSSLQCLMLPKGSASFYISYLSHPFLYVEGKWCVEYWSLNVWRRQIIPHNSSYHYWTPGDQLASFLPLSFSLSKGLFFRPDVSKPTTDWHCKQIMSNCMCVCLLRGRGVSEWEIPAGCFVQPQKGRQARSAPPSPSGAVDLHGGPLRGGLILAVAVMFLIKIAPPPQEHLQTGPTLHSNGLLLHCRGPLL